MRAVSILRPVPGRLKSVDLGAISRRGEFLLAVSVLAIAVPVVIQLWSYGLDIAEWDLLFVSGCSTVVIGLWLARGVPDRFNEMLKRLADRNALRFRGDVVTQPDLTILKDELDLMAIRWAKRCRPLTAAVLALAFLLVDASRTGDFPIAAGFSGVIVGALGGFVVGGPIGRLIAYGIAAGRTVTFVAEAEHVDGAGGLKPLGDYYLYQALLLAVPAAFLLVWSIILISPIWDARYPGWREWYLGLLGVAICLEIAAFVLPLYTVHLSMQRQKRSALANADRRLLRRIATLQTELEQQLTSTARAERREQLEDLIASYSRIERMPTWPVDPSVRRRITLGNLALILPLITQIAALSRY